MKTTRLIKRALILSLALAMLMAVPAMAASKKKKAMKAYAKYLASHTAPNISDTAFYDASYCPSSLNYVNCFFLYDINRDKVPELFTRTNANRRWFIVRIYTYKKGRILPYKMANRSAAVFNDYSGANGGYYFYVCKKKHIHNVWKGNTPFGFQTTEHVYKNSHGKLAEGTSLPRGCKEKYGFAYSNTYANRKRLKKGKISFK